MAVWTIWLVPCFCGMLTGIPMINLSANAAFGVALIGADVISLALYLRGMHARCNHPRPRPLTRLAPSSHWLCKRCLALSSHWLRGLHTHM